MASDLQPDILLMQLSLNRITPLKSPGPTSNYLDWSFVAELYFDTVKLSHVLTPINPQDWSPSWASDDAMVCLTLSQIVEDCNLWDLRDVGTTWLGCGQIWSVLIRTLQLVVVCTGFEKWSCLDLPMMTLSPTSTRCKESMITYHLSSRLTTRWPQTIYLLPLFLSLFLWIGYHVYRAYFKNQERLQFKS